MREQIRRGIQAVVEEEVTELFGRAKQARRDPIDAPEG